MHPAPSIIFFSVASGLGFGILAFLGLGFGPTAFWSLFGLFALGFALAGGGLISSTFHLGHPERALKAFTQWRSSWLSREAWLAIGAFGTAGLYALSALFATPVAPLGWLAALLCLGTVFATSMIYAQLRTVPRWHHWSTPALFLGFAIAGGAVAVGLHLLGVVSLAGLGLLLAYGWSGGDRRFGASGTDLSTATQLGDRVRAFEPPHTGPNYLLREMVHQIGRKHARRLRLLTFVAAVILPLLLLFLPAHPVLVGLVLIIHLVGALAHRWLFFAEAEHVVGLYYGRTA